VRKAETAVTAAMGEVIRAKVAVRKAEGKATAAVIAAATEGDENGDGSRLE